MLLFYIFDGYDHLKNNMHQSKIVLWECGLGWIKCVKRHFSNIVMVSVILMVEKTSERPQITDKFITKLYRVHPATDRNKNT